MTVNECVCDLTVLTFLLRFFFYFIYSLNVAENQIAQFYGSKNTVYKLRVNQKFGKEVWFCARILMHARIVSSTVL